MSKSSKMDTIQPTIKILVVDDSAFMRKALQMMLESDPMIKVVGTARDGAEGVEKAQRLKPDLITMDIEMPRMDGLTALREIMSHNPTPVMMISSLTTEGASATLDALDMGAVDFIPKQLSYVSLDIVKIKEELLAKIKHIVKRKSMLMTRLRHQSAILRNSSQSSRTKFSSSNKAVMDARPQAPSPVIRKRNHLIQLVAIGSSTGGPPALQALIPKLPANFPAPIIIVQHMPPKFTATLAERLNGLSQLAVKEAEDGDLIEKGHVYIAPGGMQMTVRKSGAKNYLKISKGLPETLYHPCVDVTLKSAVASFNSNLLAAILTGMGNNGTEGVRDLKSAGGIAIAQNEETCVVYGMPRSVIEANLADHIAPIENIAAEIASYF